MALETVVLAVGPNDADRAAALASTTVDIAGPAGATVVLAHVLTAEEFEAARANLPVGDADLTPNEVAARHETVQDIADDLEDAGVDYEVRGTIGSHGEAIVSLAETTGADLIVVGGRGRSPAGKAVFGSTSQEVMLSAPCPVTFVRGD